MQIDIQTKGFTLKSLANHASRLQSALSARDHHGSCQVHLSDIGPRGVDKCCQLTIKLAGASNVVVRDVSTDMYASIDLAAKRRAQRGTAPGANPRRQAPEKLYQGSDF